MEDIFSSLQAPTDPTPAPAPVEPVVELPAPAELVTPVEPADDSSEWDDAIKNLYPQLEQGEKEDEPAKPKEGTEAAVEDAATQTTEDPAAAVEEPATPEAEPAEPTAALTRLSEREQQAEVAAIKDDIRSKMYADTPTTLVDSTGTPIKSVSDVMTFINPSTGEAFTQDEATLWLAQAERTLEQNVAKMNRTIEQVAQTNLSLKDEADVINFNYGELLKALPEIRDNLWETYQASLRRDPKTGIVMEAPKSLKDFYEKALEPYAQLARKLENDAENRAAATAEAEANNAEYERLAKQQRRQDRSDIYGSGKTDNADPEDDEWGEAAKAVFGDQLRK